MQAEGEDDGNVASTLLDKSWRSRGLSKSNIEASAWAGVVTHEAMLCCLLRTTALVGAAFTWTLLPDEYGKNL